MTRRGVLPAAAIVAIAGALGGCGGADKPAAETGMTVHGQTESGMRMTVTTFVAPSGDPTLRAIDAYRAAARFPAVDYDRVIADNTRGTVADSGRVVTFAPNVGAIQRGTAIDASFACDVLRLQWQPPEKASAALRTRYAGLVARYCRNGPPKTDGIAAGAKQTYYLVTQREFAERGIRRLKVYGPAGVLFTPAA